jgi:hypothetical protein
MNMVRNLSSTIIHNKFYMHCDPQDETFEETREKSRGKVFEEEGVVKYSIQEGEKEINITPDEVATAIYESMQRTSTIKTKIIFIILFINNCMQELLTLPRDQKRPTKLF